MFQNEERMSASKTKQVIISVIETFISIYPGLEPWNLLIRSQVRYPIMPVNLDRYLSGFHEIV